MGAQRFIGMSGTTTPAPASAPVSKTKLGPREWLEIISLVRQGVKVAKIAETYDVDQSVVYKGLKKRGINVAQLQQVAALEALQEVANKDRAELVKRIRETKDEDYRFTSALQKSVMRVVLDAQKPGAARTLAAVLDDVKALKLAIDAVRNGTDNKFRLLGIDKENANADEALPELPIREMTDLEVESMRNRQAQEDGLGEEDLEIAELEGLVEDEEITP